MKIPIFLVDIPFLVAVTFSLLYLTIRITWCIAFHRGAQAYRQTTQPRKYGIR